MTGLRVRKNQSFCIHKMAGFDREQVCYTLSTLELVGMRDRFQQNNGRMMRDVQVGNLYIIIRQNDQFLDTVTITLLIRRLLCNIQISWRKLIDKLPTHSKQ